MVHDSAQDGRETSRREVGIRQDHISRREYLAEKAQGPGRFEPRDDTPVELPVGLNRPPTIQEEIRRYMQDEFRRRDAEQAEAESFEEFDDFGEEDPEPELESPYVLQDEDGVPVFDTTEEGEVAAKPAEESEGPQDAPSQPGPEAVDSSGRPEPD